MIQLLLVFSVIFSSHSAWSQDSTNTSTTVVPVEASKAPALKFDVVDSNFESTEKIIIDEEAIQNSRSTNVAQVLANQANINVVSTNFLPNSIFVRGGDSSHVLVLIDDVPAYDASTLQRSINLSNLNISNVKRIEVLKGSQVVLYGGQALSAVIKIYTVSKEFKTESKVTAQLRRKNGIDSGAHFSKAVSDQALVSLDARFASLTNPSPVLNSQKSDGYAQKIAATQLGFTLKNENNFKTNFKLNYSEDDNDIPTTTTGSAAADIDDFASDTKSSGATITLNSNDQLQFSVSNQKTIRELRLAPFVHQKYEGDLVNARLDANGELTSKVRLQGGLAYGDEKVSAHNAGILIVDQIKQQNESYFAKTTIQPMGENNKDLILEAGYRSEFTKGKSQTNSMQLGVSAFEDLKLEASTGSRRPSLSQRFDPMYGNENLENEKAVTLNASYRHEIDFQTSAAVALFDSNYENLIDCVGSSRNCKMFNINAARTTGAELSANHYNEINGYGLRGYVAYQEPRDLGTGAWLFRRPLRTAGLQLKKDWSDKFDTLIEAVHTGSRRDKLSRTESTTLSAYTLLNLTANYRMQKDLVVFGRIDNLQDKTYETTFGYYVQGAELRAGLEKRF